MTVHRDLLQGDIAWGDGIQIYVQQAGADTSVLYYYGTIVSVPGDTARDAVTYEAEGLWFQAQAQPIVKYYAGKDTDDMVGDILDDIQTTNSDISTNDSEIVISSPYAIGDLEAEDITAAEAIKAIAEVQGDVQYGCDQLGRLYFKDLSTTENAHFFVGKHLSDFHVQKLTDKVVNRVIMQSKKVVGGGFLTLSRDDTTSSTKIATLGIRGKVVPIPQFQDPDDVWRYGGNYLDEHGEREVCTCKPTNFTEFIFPRGKARIVDTDGTEYSLPIQSVKYKIDPTVGVVGTMELGDEAPPSAENELRDLLREIAINKSSMTSITKFEHTGAEEFAQAVRVDALKQGNLNNFIDTLDNAKVFLENDSYHPWLRHNQLLCPLDTQFTELITNIIPSGREVDTVRLHTKVDTAGRINFLYPEDITDFFETGTADWTIKEEDNLLECHQGGANPLWYKDEHLDVPASKVGFSLGTSYYVKFKLNYNATSMTGGVMFFFGWSNSNNYNNLRLQNGAANLTMTLAKNVAGVPTDLETATLTKDTDYVVRIFGDATASRFWVWNADESSLLFTSSTYALAMPNYARCGPNNWYDVGGSQPWFYLDWFEFWALGIVGSFVSRDGGANYTSQVNLDGTEHQDISVSGLAAGTDLVVKFKMKHPARIKGWGISWKNTD
jgi:hypothetical protein